MILREKILLGLVGAAAVGAVVVYAPGWFTPEVPKSSRVPIDVPTLTAKVQLDLKQTAPTIRERRVLAAATNEWVRNPLRDRPLVVEKQVEPDDAPVDYLTPVPEYVGYMSIGSLTIAIIDGQDYREGEQIDGGEFTLIGIYPDHVQLLREGASDPVDVPLEEPLLTGRPQSGSGPRGGARPPVTEDPIEERFPPGINGPFNGAELPRGVRSIESEQSLNSGESQ